ncbi:hypothetical protein QM012_008171 [Aureobasidium pullulans]|uniref:Xylanolytic transcriptional activator regulatory domain-containing protein n=1 Tax=Aureobasidium pullulans TaxID=5580 RepID=A0ABR0TIP4_AURPU
MSETRNLPTPPSHSPDRNSEGQNSQPSSPLEDEHHMVVLAGSRSPPPSEDMLLDASTQALGTGTVRVAGSVLSASIRYHQREHAGCPPLDPVERAVPVVDQYSPHNSHLSSRSRDISSINEWDATDMTGSIAGFEDWLTASNNGLTGVQSFYGHQNMGADDFDLITMDSMALNNAALDADLSTYMNHYAPNPFDKAQEDRTRSPIHTPVVLPESSSLPIEASALNVGITSPQSSDVFLRMPSLLKETPRRIVIPPALDEDSYYAIMADVKSYMPFTTEMELLLSLQDMHQFMKCYMVCFHRHCPIIHLPSLDLKATPALILAMCAIGALYRLRRKTAHDLWQCAKNICETELDADLNGDPLTASATSALQCRLLVSWFAIFSGDMTEQGISASGFWSTRYRSLRVLLQSTPYNSGNATWTQWILRETAKRLLYGIFIMSSMASLTYDLLPMFSVTQDLDVELLDEEKLWEASSSPEWDELRQQRDHQSKITLRHAFTHLVLGKEHALSTATTSPMRWTAFSTSVIMHAVNVYMWNLMQCTQSFSAFAVESSNDSTLKTAMVNQTEAALARCYALLTADRPEGDRTSDDPEGPLLFNCLALLRSAHTRVFTGADNYNRMTLLSGSARHVSASINAFVSGNALERGPLMTRAVDKAYGGFLTPIKAGYLLVRKTAALTWSLEHPIAAWDCALFATKWVHTLEMSQLEAPPDQDELMIISNFRNLLSEADSEYNGCGSLAGEIMRVWASLFDDTWTWGITPRMGHVMRRLSGAFKQDWKSRFPEGNPGGSISQ